MPELVFGCAALKSPPCDFSTSFVFAGWGVLKGWNRLDFGASGALSVAAAESLSLLAEVALLSCAVPKMLNPELLAAGVAAAGGVAGFASDANGLDFGVSGAAVLLASSGFFRLPNRFVEGAGVVSCA